MATKESYVVTIYLDRDPGVTDEELVRSLSDWKRLKDEGRNPPKWSKETPTTLEGFIRLLMLNGPHAPLGVPGGIHAMPFVSVFTAPAHWTPVLAQAMSFMAFGLRPGSYLDVARSKTTKAAAGVCGVSHRRFEVVPNGDGEPEVEEVRVDA